MEKLKETFLCKEENMDLAKVMVKMQDKINEIIDSINKYSGILL